MEGISDLIDNRTLSIMEKSGIGRNTSTFISRNVDALKDVNNDVHVKINTVLQSYGNDMAAAISIK